jgi:hypothetical protein
MNRYCIKCRTGRIEYFDILSENEYGYTVKLIKMSDGDEKVSEEFISRHLFNICVKTGYICKMEAPAVSVA